MKITNEIIICWIINDIFIDKVNTLIEKNMFNNQIKNLYFEKNIDIYIYNYCVFLNLDLSKSIKNQHKNNNYNYCKCNICGYKNLINLYPKNFDEFCKIYQESLLFNCNLNDTEEFLNKFKDNNCIIRLSKTYNNMIVCDYKKDDNIYHYRLYYDHQNNYIKYKNNNFTNLESLINFIDVNCLNLYF